jgi:hypothetical protein
VWGSIVWVHDASGGKLDPRAKDGRWVGFDFSSKGHRIYWPSKRSVSVECSVVFTRHAGILANDDLVAGDVEDRGSELGEEDDADEDTNHDALNTGAEVAEEDQDQEAEEDDEQDEEAIAEELTRGDTETPEPMPAPNLPVPNAPVPPAAPMQPVRRSSRARLPSQYVRDIQSGKFSADGKTKSLPRGIRNPDNADLPQLDEEVGGVAMAAVMSDAEALEPRNLKEAMNSPDWSRWKEAMDDELASLESHGTWRAEHAPAGTNIVGCRWVFAVKRDAAGNITRYKARLVAQGYSQVPGVDFFDTYAPVAKMASIRTVLALAARLDYEIHQVDVKNAYLNGEFEKEEEVIYMKVPPGTELTSGQGQVLLLLRPLY